MTDPTFESIAILSRRLARGEVSSREITGHFLKRIAAHNGELNAYSDVFAEDAMAAALVSDSARVAGRPRSALDGIPIAVKDLCDMAGKRCMAGSATWADRIATADCTVVEKLKAAGMVILGRTQMVEFAFGTWGTNPRLGTPKNPWDRAPHRVPGGSSSGSGVAVAAGLAPAAIGSDTGGSVRIPAALNGITGLKTTSGLISLAHVIPLAATLDTIGPMTRTVEDAAILTELLQGADPKDDKTRAIPAGHRFAAPDGAGRPDLTGLTIVRLPAADVAPPADGETVAAVEAAARHLASLGATITERSLPVDFASLTKQNFELTAAEAFQNYGEAAADPDKPFGEGVRKRILSGQPFQGDIYDRARAAHEAAARTFAQWIAPNEILLAPTVPFPAIPVAEVSEAVSPMAHFTRSGNFLRASSLSLPGGLSSGGLPIGIMLTAGPWREDVLVRAGLAWQATTDHHRATPPGF